ncbi:MAG: hypothetical protein ACQER9_03215 [Nanobdellota archaeon]
MIKEKVKQIISKAKEDIPTESHLAHVFIMPPSTFDFKKDNLNIDSCEVHVGYYNRETKKLVIFKDIKGNIEKEDEQDIFQKEKEEVPEISLDDLEIDENEALKKVVELAEEKYKNTVSLKTLMILQKLKDKGFIWNITILRRDFKNLNVKIDAKKGDILHDNCSSLVDLNKQMNDIKEKIAEKKLKDAKDKPSSGKE